MKLYIYNSLTKQKEEFKPLQAGKVSLYVCGMTVYDYCHIGHARLMLVFDMITHYLRDIGYEVTYVQNITDIDDKIIRRANENKEAYTAVTGRFIEALQQDLAQLKIANPDIQPKATEYIPSMLELITILMKKGVAYVAKNGDVMYSITKFNGYGKLAHRDIADLRAGARVEIDEAKQDPLDFVLWKLSKPGEPSWRSPWGAGRPGWHLECSAMVMSCLGDQIDIHGGGMDLKFPHHENEIAQSEVCTERQFVNTWMHVGFLQIDNEKMSKSLGNFFYLKDALKRFSTEQIRYFMLATHYRKPIHYSEDNLVNAQEALTRLYTALRGVKIASPLENSSYEQAFRAAMNDDFNTPEAMAVLFSIVKELNKIKLEQPNQAGSLAGLLKYLAGFMGILQQESEIFFQSNTQQATRVNHEKIAELIAGRELARSNKEWEKADQIRKELTMLGVTLEDTSKGTVWKFNH